MSLEKLLSVLTPPNEPVDKGVAAQWAGIEQKMGLMLPADYKEFINLFGSGIICNYLWVLNPFSPLPGISLTEATDIRDQYQVLIGEDDNFPYRLYPQAGGLLPCVITDDISILAWITHGLPNEWKLLWLDKYIEIIDLFDYSLTEFLYRFVDGQYKHNARIPEILIDRNKLYMTPDEFNQYNGITPNT